MTIFNPNLSRRAIVKAGLLGAGALVLPRFAIGKPGLAANGKLNIALVGGGGIARSALRDCSNENVIAIADVDEVSGALGFEAFPKAKRYKDFRKMLDAHYKELDLVIVNTPDHTHFAATYMAMERGIAVHTQKPLTHNIWEARTLQAAAQKFKVQTVMGNQGHNYEEMRLIKDWYDAGLAGEVREVHAWTGRTTQNNANGLKTFPRQAIPGTLDWDLWQGPRTERPYNETYCPKGWRWHWDYGTGVTGDIGCHTLDVPVYVIGLGYPTAVYRKDSLDFRREYDGKTPGSEAVTLVYEFPARGSRPAVTVYWYEGGNMPKFPDAIQNGEEREDLTKGGCMLVGDKNTIFTYGIRPGKPRMVKNWAEISRNLPEKTTPRAVGNPVQEIKAAIRGEIPKCGSNFDYAAPLTETVMLGVVALRSRKMVEYDPATMTFSDSVLNAYVKEPVRKGWEHGEGLIEAAPGAALATLSLFNGKDLSGWKYVESAPFTAQKHSLDKRFSAKDDIFTVNEGSGVQKIWTEREFDEDFVLKLEFRAGVEADSGIYLRGPQLQCRDYLTVGPYKELKHYRPQEWNQIEVLVKGQTATCTCNGELLAFDKPLPPKGPIGLEADKKQMEYRNIEITLLR